MHEPKMLAAGTCSVCGQPIQPTDSVGGTSYRTLHLSCFLAEDDRDDGDRRLALRSLPAPDVSRAIEIAFRL